LASSKTCIQQVATEAPEISKRTTILTNRHTGTKLRQKKRGKIVKGKLPRTKEQFNNRLEDTQKTLSLFDGNQTQYQLQLIKHPQKK
jgi:hypothetical protein